MIRKKLIKNDTKDIFLIISSFIIGSLITLIIVNYTPFGHKSRYIITKNETQVYEKQSLAASVEKIYDAVVVVEGYRNSTLSSEGTGFIYKVDNRYGYILTNEHVVTNTENIMVTFSNDEKIEAKLLGKDEYIDLAVLRINKKYVSLVATMGKSKEMKLGDTVFTVGSPLGYNYRGSITSGILSGKDRLVTTSISTSSNNDWIMKVLQVDAAINPGNSGGPLLNVNGEVVGVCTLKFVDNNIEGMSFAIPIEDAMNYIETLENGEQIKWPSLGIDMINVSDQAKMLINNLEINNKITEGVAVISIDEKSSAYNSGLKKGDIITKINENKIKDTSYLRYELYKYRAGDTINITYIRNNKEQKVKVILNSK